MEDEKRERQEEEGEKGPEHSFHWSVCQLVGVRPTVHMGEGNSTGDIQALQTREMGGK